MAAMRTLLLLLGFSLFLAPPMRASGDEALEREVDAYLAPLVERDLISGSVLIARGGEIRLAKGYGLANREHGVPNAPDTKFRLGSISKPITSLAVFLLAQEGALALEDQLAVYLPDYPRGSEITLHMLLTHTSGVRNYNELEDYDTRLRYPWGIDEVIAFFRDEPLLFAPGRDWAYSNSGYVLLAKVIELVSERPFAEFLRERIFDPLGMTGSGVDEPTTILPGRATGHAHYDGELCQAPYRYMPFTSGAGALYSTVLDLHALDRALVGDDLLGEEWREKMFTPVRNDYACG